jgi:hypothetical protein
MGSRNTSIPKMDFSDGAKASPISVSRKIPSPRSALDSLRRTDFHITEISGISYLVKKLLLNPLPSTARDTYFIIDGVDEADMITKEVVERGASTEMEALIRSLCKLPVHPPVFSLTRALLISRTSSKK